MTKNCPVCAANMAARRIMKSIDAKLTLAISTHVALENEIVCEIIAAKNEIVCEIIAAIMKSKR